MTFVAFWKKMLNMCLLKFPKDVFNTGKSIVIGEIYRPPIDPVEEFNLKLENLLRQIG